MDPVSATSSGGGRKLNSIKLDFIWESCGAVPGSKDMGNHCIGVLVELFFCYQNRLFISS